MMKFIRIFLLVLIILGIGLLCTQKYWVPKVVAHILANESEEAAVTPASPMSPQTQPNVTLTNGRQCYTYSHEATADAPYTVSEFLDITITGTNVTGKKTGTQKGPDMTNGYSGSITGTLSNNSITDVFAYTVEGSKNKEQEIYRASKVGIEKLRYPLVEKPGMLVLDTTKDFTAMSYARVECEGSN